MKNVIVSMKLMVIATISFGMIQFLGSCNKDDGEDLEVVASFQYETSESNFLEITFKNFSKNHTSSSWDFGDGNSSTDESPTHTFSEAGTYKVVLTVKNDAGESSSKTESINVQDPDDVAKLLFGDVSKKWILKREGIALGIGEAPNNTVWWNLGEVAPLGDRPCVLDDEYTFFADGTFGFNSNGTFFMDSEEFGGWNDDDFGEGCHDESEPGVWTGSDGMDYSAYANGGDYTFALDKDELTIDGLGAYIGLAVKTASGDNKTPQASKTYKVLTLADGPGVDTLTIALVNADNSAWTFYLLHYEDESQIPDIPSAMPAAAFSFSKTDFEVTFTNTSKNATTYSWDFGDGNTSTDKDPVHTYAGAGTYTVKLTASDDDGNSDEAMQDVTVSSAAFGANTLFSSTGKVWKMAPIAGAMKVGPGVNDGSWWQNTEGDVTTRSCAFDDEYIFTDGGNFEYKNNGDLWAESYMGLSEGCVNESELKAPWDAIGSNNGHTCTVDMTGEKPMITVKGTGAFIVLPKAFNGGEHPGDGSGTPKSEVTYEVLDYSISATEETIVIGIDISAGQDKSAYWTYTLVHTL